MRIPGALVDVVVPVSDRKYHMQTFGTQYDPALSGTSALSRRPTPLKMDIRKLIGRRCIMELKEGTIVNLGIGLSEIVAAVAYEEEIGETVTFTIEGGVTGGMVLSGMDFGAAAAPECMMDQASMFDFYDGGGLDEAFLGLAQCDRLGNINVSRFGSRIAAAAALSISARTRKKWCSAVPLQQKIWR